MFGNQIIMMRADFHHLKKKIWTKKKKKKKGKVELLST